MQLSPDKIRETLLRCEDEPIRVPGSVQQHGFFLLVDAAFEKVLVASENAERFLRQPLRLILGARLDALLERELLLALLSVRDARHQNVQALVTYLGSFRIADDQFSVMAHNIGSMRALEFEKQDRLVGTEMMNSIVTNFVATLGRLQTTQDLCDALTAQMAELTQFDRVMAYRFDEEAHGTVLSEVSNGHLPSYLGLRFPASDIPRQARELYVLNTTRIIPDATYTPSPLVGSMPLTASQLDLSLSVLRSVSPVHLQYMRNMGTAASMSVSIVLDGKLWGLVSCHNSSPKTVPYLVRSACDMLTKVAATQLTKFDATARLKDMVHFHNAQRDLLTILASEQNYQAALLRESHRLLQITNASGVATLVDGRFSSEGVVPNEAVLQRLSEWLDEDEDRNIFASSHLAAVLPWAESIRDVGSGMLAVRISSVQRRYVMWFRPEVTATVRWAGEPVKQEEANLQLTPRASFGIWNEIIRGRCEPWTSMEIESATEFRAALTAIGLRRAEEAIELGEARFQQLTQALPVKVFTVDDAGQLTYVNERWLENGLPSTGLWLEQISLHPEDAEMCGALWRDCVATGKSFARELRLKPIEGNFERWNFARVVPFQRTGATRAGWIGILIDLTESKEREMALRISEKLALTGRMTSVIAHEINNPLEAITNLMYLLRRESNNNGPAANYIGLVESELERISGVTKQTLRWNRESNDQPQMFDFRVLVDEVLRLFAGKIGNKQLTVERAGDAAIEVWAVLRQVRQVLANLVSNAIDAAPVGGTLGIRVQEQPTEVALIVQDNGNGISEETRARLFEPFFSTKGDLGNGLGLYISREIVERHRGRIEVRSDSGHGTTMTVWLPRPGDSEVVSASPR